MGNIFNFIMDYILYTMRPRLHSKPTSVKLVSSTRISGDGELSKSNINFNKKVKVLEPKKSKYDIAISNLNSLFL